MGMRLRSVIAAAVVTAVASPAMAGLLNTDEGYTGPVIDLSSREGIVGPLGSDAETAAYGYTIGPVVLPGMRFTRSGIPADTNSGLGAVLGQGQYQLGLLDPPGLPNNGAFGAGAVYAGLDGPSGYMQFELTGGTGVSAFGAYVNYSPGSGLKDPNDPFNGNPYIAALDVNGNVLESFDLVSTAGASISTPGAFNSFLFRGISRDSSDIFGLRFGNAYILAAGSANGLVPTGGPVPAVPEPQTYALMLAGLGAVAFMARRRRAQPA